MTELSPTRPRATTQPPTIPEGGEVGVDAPRNVWELGFTTFGRNRLALVGLVFLVLLALACFVGPLLYHTNQVAVNLAAQNQPPSGSHLLGTDSSGYDVLGRILLGGQSSLELGFAVAIVATVIGTLYGAISAFAGGIIDSLLMRLVDTLQAIPVLVALIIMVTLVNPTLPLIILVLALTSWLDIARLVRAEVLTLRERDYVAATTMMGGTSRRIILRHLVPNAMGIIIVNATFTIADAILAMSSLGFLGLGLPPPHADWGGMLSNGIDYLYDGYWWLIYPVALVLILTIIAVRVIGDAIRDSFDVRLLQR